MSDAARTLLAGGSSFEKEGRQVRRITSGTQVVIRAPRRLRGVNGTVLRPVDGGYEVGFLLDGMPLHAVLRPRRLRVLEQPTAA